MLLLFVSVLAIMLFVVPVVTVLLVSRLSIFSAVSVLFVELFGCFNFEGFNLFLSWSTIKGYFIFDEFDGGVYFCRAVGRQRFNQLEVINGLYSMSESLIFSLFLLLLLLGGFFRSLFVSFGLLG